ncbi:hypothetical protein KSS87_017141 [Heliosperma pusillum]|nr:hypothetical protein KSS87_017141 [Heliosperma pusillum]
MWGRRVSDFLAKKLGGGCQFARVPLRNGWSCSGGGTNIVAAQCNHHEYRSKTVLSMLLQAQAALFIGGACSFVFSEQVSTPIPDIGLKPVEDGSVISNDHTSKWRIFTDNGREFFMQGKLNEAEKLFSSALEEAKKGFGDRDPHVASACNNLAELYRIRKCYDKAEPLYLDAIRILEEAFGSEDVRVGAACHNLGQFYIVQRKLQEARSCYEIKGRVLGYGHPDYAETMFHLGTVLYLQGNVNDSEVLIKGSIQILEEGGQGESYSCIRKLRYLAKVYMNSKNRLEEAENVQRKILHIMELTKGWKSLDTVIAAETLTVTLQSKGQLKDAQELLERCLDVRRELLPEDHLQQPCSSPRKTTSPTTTALFFSNEYYGTTKIYNIEDPLIHYYHRNRTPPKATQDTLATPPRQVVTVVVRSSKKAISPGYEDIMHTITTTTTNTPLPPLQRFLAYDCPGRLDIGANMLSLANVALLNSEKLRKIATSESLMELDRAKKLIEDSMRIAQKALDASKHKRKIRNLEQRSGNDQRIALVIFSFRALLLVIRCFINSRKTFILKTILTYPCSSNPFTQKHNQPATLAHFPPTIPSHQSSTALAYRNCFHSSCKPPELTPPQYVIWVVVKGGVVEVQPAEMAGLMCYRLWRRRSLFMLWRRHSCWRALRSLKALAHLEKTKNEIQDIKKALPVPEAEKALRQCMRVFKEAMLDYAINLSFKMLSLEDIEVLVDCPTKLIHVAITPNFPTVSTMRFKRYGAISTSVGPKVEYILCLKNLLDMIGDAAKNATKSRLGEMEELKDEIRRAEAEILSPRTSSF